MNILTINEYADKSKEHYYLGIYKAEKKYKEYSVQNLEKELLKLNKQNMETSDAMEKQNLAGMIYYVSKKLNE